MQNGGPRVKRRRASRERDATGRILGKTIISPASPVILTEQDAFSDPRFLANARGASKLNSCITRASWELNETLGDDKSARRKGKAFATENCSK